MKDWLSFWPSSGKSFGILIFAVMLPVLLAILVFPTAMYDTRELIAWGREFPLITPAHPPIMAWIGGVVDWALGPSAAATIFVGQILLLAGLTYFYATLALIVSRQQAAFVTFLFGTSFYTIFAPLSFALNADLLQLTSWPAVVFHLLKAARSNRWRHWIAFGIFSAIAMLTKYNAVILFVGLAAGMVAVPFFRQLFMRPRLYVAIAIGIVLLVPHLWAAMRHVGPIQYGLEHFETSRTLAEKAGRLYELLLGYALFIVPGGIIVAAGFIKRFLSLRSRVISSPPDLQLLLTANIVMQIAVLSLIMIAGLDYLFRFAPPYVMMAAFALAPLVELQNGWENWFERQVVTTIAALCLVAFAAVTVVYTIFASHSGMQEPTAEAARAILADWRNTYACGPGYFVGARPRVYGVGIDAHPKVSTLAYREISEATWFDSKLFRNQGAIVLDAGSDVQDHLDRFLPGIAVSPERQVIVPLLRTFKTKTMTFSYRFISPQGCSSQR